MQGLVHSILIINGIADGETWKSGLKRIMIGNKECLGEQHSRMAVILFVAQRGGIRSASGFLLG
eukprot:1140522-Pelagomonas_calceolata.AAC.2